MSDNVHNLSPISVGSIRHLPYINIVSVSRDEFPVVCNDMEHTPNRRSVISFLSL